MRIKLHSKYDKKLELPPAVELQFSKKEVGREIYIDITAKEAIRIGLAGLELKKILESREGK